MNCIDAMPHVIVTQHGLLIITCLADMKGALNQEVQAMITCKYALGLIGDHPNMLGNHSLVICVDADLKS